MENILSRRNQQVLQQFAWSRVLLAFDYDGTLAPIVADPARAVMSPSTRRLLRQLTALYPCIVVSGRGRADVLRLVEGLGFLKVVGNHGLESGRRAEKFTKQVESWRAILEAELGDVQGIVIEDKGQSLSIHYRRSREKRKARASIARALALLGTIRIIGGKQVVNVLPEGAGHKGIAVETQRDRLRCDTVLYMGDDQTDEDVFALEQPGRLLTIRVGASSQSAAAFFVRSQREVDEVLQVLVTARQALRRAGRAT